MMKLPALTLAALMAATSMTALAAEVTDAQIDIAMKIADPDKDGTLDMKEAARLGISKAAFEHANPDKDGTLDKAELRAAIKWQFEKANPDNDGTLDMKEAAAAGIKDKAIFEAANPDKDGTLDMAEYVDALIKTASK